MNKKYIIIGAILLVVVALVIVYLKYFKNSYTLKDLFNFGGMDKNGNKTYYLSAVSLARLNDVNPILIDIFKEAIKDSPYDFGIPKFGGKRTVADQQYLYAKGRTSGGSIVTNADGVNKKSYHQSGNAVDFYAYVDGKATWNSKYYEPIARHIQEVAKKKYNVDLKWGGDWANFKDLPHLQI